jgi:hypothetical protein
VSRHALVNRLVAERERALNDAERLASGGCDDAHTKSVISALMFEAQSYDGQLTLLARLDKEHK